MEEEKEVKVVMVDYKCPKCENGYMRPNGRTYPMYPPLHQHQCNCCDYTENFSNKKYPYIDYR